jgi:rhodanese-related sulfurtransferase
MRYRLFITIGISVMIIAGFMSFAFTGGKNSYTTQDVKEKIDGNDEMLILDVRTPREFSGELGHLPGAKLLPVQELHRRIDELQEYRDSEIVVICRTDNRSQAAASILRDAGFERVSFVRGGMVAWNRLFGRPESEKGEE